MIAGQPITHRAVWSMAGPIILANLSVPLVGAVDTAVVGHLPGPEYIGAVALGALIFSFLYWGFGFLRMGTTGFVARTLGAADHANGNAALLEDRPLLDVGFEQRAQGVLAAGFGALVRDARKLVAERLALGTRQPIGEVAFEQSREHPRGDHRRRETRA